MITMRELMKDPAYEAYIRREPSTPQHAADKSLSGQWVIYLRKTSTSRWTRKSFRKYKKALKFFLRAYDAGYYDLAFNNRRLWFKPPLRKVRIKGKYKVGSDGVTRQVVKMIPWVPKISGEQPAHDWCSSCRRPTVFGYYSRHPAINLPEINPSVPRCSICGLTSQIGYYR